MTHWNPTIVNTNPRAGHRRARASTRRLVAWAVACVLAGCVDLAPARKHARIQAAANEGHAADAALPPQARAIGQANADAWAAQVKHLGDE